MRFGPFLVFAALGSALVYAVLAHWAFGGGWLQAGGTLGFAGGVPVEMGCGFSALAVALVVGARKDDGGRPCSPQRDVRPARRRPAWFGGFGFNGGNGCSTGNASVLAFTNTLLCPACTLIVWFALELIRGRKVTGIGAATAIVVGCVAMTPAGGFVSPGWAMLLGALAAAAELRDHRLAARGPGSTRPSTCSRLTGPRACSASSSWASSPRSPGTAPPTASSTATPPSSATRRWPPWPHPPTPSSPPTCCCGLIGAVTPLRASDREEAQGMDIVQHGEEAYTTGEGAILVIPDGRRERSRSRSPTPARREVKATSQVGHRYARSL